MFASVVSIPVQICIRELEPSIQWEIENRFRCLDSDFRDITEVCRGSDHGKSATVGVAVQKGSLKVT